MNSSRMDDERIPGPDAPLSHAKSAHDLRASLAVTNGFNQALETSFSELCDTYAQLLASGNSQTANDNELQQKAEALEGDCRFCLSRIEQCLEKLSVHIEKNTFTGHDAEDSEHLTS